MLDASNTATKGSTYQERVVRVQRERERERERERVE
jgi:hypothetical protein